VASSKELLLAAIHHAARMSPEARQAHNVGMGRSTTVSGQAASPGSQAGTAVAAPSGDAPATPHSGLPPIAAHDVACHGEEGLKDRDDMKEPLTGPAGHPEARRDVLFEHGGPLLVGDVSVIHPGTNTF
jgi:hypothetical protein